MTDLLVVLIVVLVIALIVRGPKTLPQIGAMFGSGIREAKKAAKDVRPDDAADPAGGSQTDS